MNQPFAAQLAGRKPCICPTHWQDHGPFECPHHGHVTEHLDGRWKVALREQFPEKAEAILALVEALELQNKASGLVPQVLTALEALND